MKIISGKMIAGGFGLALLPLCGVGVASYQSVQRLNENRQWVEHTYQVLNTLDQVRDGLKLADDGGLRYIITGNELYRKSSAASLQMANKALKGVRQLTRDNPQQQHRLDEIEPRVAKASAFIQQSIDQLQQNSSDKTAQTAITEQLWKIEQEIQARLAVMQNEERTLLQQRSVATDASVDNTNLIFSIGYCLSFSLLLGVFLLFQKQRRDRKAVEEERSNLIAILEATPDIVATATTDRQTHYLNSAARKLFGIGAGEDAANFNIDKAQPHWAAEIVRTEGIPTAMRGGVWLGNTALLSHDGREIPVSQAIVAHKSVDGTVKFISTVARDISELTEANIVLQAEIAERKQAERKLEELTTDLQRSNQELEQFAYVASHDLQEPLRAVTSYTQMLARRYSSQLDEKADKYIGYIVDGATRMQQLIQDLLAYSRVGRHELKLQPTDCNTVLHRVIKDLQVTIAENEALVTFDPLPTVIADTAQIVQLFQNLISNAIKYRGEEPPQVHVSASQQESEWTFSVRDNGIGIEPQYFERIFIIFQRLHTRKEYSGTGLGLAICKKIVEQHNGRIWAESQLGCGSTFYFTLPFNQ